ncbi:MAG TPA: phenylalanine--tRNA ligase subunit beta, partial [Elusimicrobiota bacterium]|nr:phenylalanine--tRNA ligase subunit beta [Elusimicrobiota bacterium]
SPEELAALLRRQGFDVASITRFGGDVQNVVTAKVESVQKHPNADRLSLCKVFDGKNRLDVVCGAPNVAAGQTVPLARVGARVAGGLEIKRAVIRGQESHGMLCSARELGLGDDHGGILILPEDVPLGKDAAAVLAMGDAVLDVEVTPNRPDALSHWGLAREIAAALKKKVRLPEMRISKAKRDPSLVKIEETTLCTRYVGRALEGVKVSPSPLWMKLRLERCGIRSINNVVDITNYVLLEMGHPLHAFDRDKLKEGRVVVRRAAEGETLLCLDGVTRSLGNHLVIADAAAPTALAGVIGGEPTAVHTGTGRLLLESAHFQAAAVRRARMALAVSTESSYRFERGTDWDMADLASRRAAHLILQIAGGTLLAELDARGKKPPEKKAVKARPARINLLLGFPIAPAEIKKTLERLGFVVKGSPARFSVLPPMHRHDVKEEADVAEEIARMTSYDKVPTRIRTAPQTPHDPSRENSLVRLSGDFLAAQGFWEAKNYGLLSRAAWEKCRTLPDEATVELANPMSLSGELLAPALLPLLIGNLQTNARRGNKNVRLFECARTFRQADGKILEPLCLAWVAEGDAQAPHWTHRPRPLDIWDAKAWAKGLFSAWGLDGIEFRPGPGHPFLHPAENLSIHLGGVNVGYLGKLHPRRAEEWELPQNVYAAELDLSFVAAKQPKTSKFAGLPKHPAVFRDFSVVFPEKTPWTAIADRLARHTFVDEIELFDVFKDATLPTGHHSLAFRIAFRDPERTLTDAEVGEIQKSLLADVQSAFGASLRLVGAKNTSSPGENM